MGGQLHDQRFTSERSVPDPLVWRLGGPRRRSGRATVGNRTSVVQPIASHFTVGMGPSLTSLQRELPTHESYERLSLL